MHLYSLHTPSVVVGTLWCLISGLCVSQLDCIPLQFAVACLLFPPLSILLVLVVCANDLFVLGVLVSKVWWGVCCVTLHTESTAVLVCD